MHPLASVTMAETTGHVGQNTHLGSDEQELSEVLALFSQWMHDYATSIRSRFSKFDTPSEFLFLTRFGQRYGGFGLAGRLAALLREVGVQDWERGVWLLAGVNLQEHVSHCRTPPDE